MMWEMKYLKLRRVYDTFGSTLYVKMEVRRTEEGRPGGGGGGEGRGGEGRGGEGRGGEGRE